MKTAVRLTICTALAAAAVTMASFTIAGFTGREDPQEVRAPYLLGEAGGYVAVFDPADRGHPLRVTEIEMSSLRTLDRERIAAGLPIGSREELAGVLEDLGS